MGERCQRGGHKRPPPLPRAGKVECHAPHLSEAKAHESGRPLPARLTVGKKGELAKADAGIEMGGAGKKGAELGPTGGEDGHSHTPLPQHLERPCGDGRRGSQDKPLDPAQGKPAERCFGRAQNKRALFPSDCEAFAIKIEAAHGEELTWALTDVDDGRGLRDAPKAECKAALGRRPEKAQPITVQRKREGGGCGKGGKVARSDETFIGRTLPAKAELRDGDAGSG